MRSSVKATALVAVLSASGQARAITWEAQAERLQNVYASLLDSTPVLDPLLNASSVRGFAHISLLPKVNATVGAKTEKAPQPPIHAVPSLQGTFVMGAPHATRFGLSLYGGYLPSGAEGLLGLDAKMTQWQVGFVPTVNIPLNPAWEFYAAAGIHMTSAHVTGHVTGPESDDDFTVDTQIYALSVGTSWTATGLWLGLLAGYKSTKSAFEIKSDDTKFEIEDSLDDAAVPLITQVSLGWRHSSGVGAALSELIVPARYFTTRVTLSYDYMFGPGSESAGPTSSPKAPKGKAKPAPRKPGGAAKPAPGGAGTPAAAEAAGAAPKAGSTAPAAPKPGAAPANPAAPKAQPGVKPGSPAGAKK